MHVNTISDSPKTSFRKAIIISDTFKTIPLVRDVIDNNSRLLRPRKVDRNWFYNGFVPVSLSGFSPHSGHICYSGRSAFSEWLPNSDGSARQFNEGDFLVHELFFIVHDFLHAWAFSEVRKLVPELLLGEGPITRENREDFLFCYILSETVATVGLDYWYLCNINLNDIVDVGTCFQSLTVSFRSSEMSEYRRFNNLFDVCTPAFFEQHNRFYQSGEFLGFGVDDIRLSPLLHRWLRHEISYGEVQRKYGRLWLNHLAGENLYSDKDSTLCGPVECSKEWALDVTRTVGRRLWECIQAGKFSGVLSIPSNPWRSEKSRGGKLDGRFDNLSGIDVHSFKESGFVDGTQAYACYQLISRFDYALFNSDKLSLVTDACKGGRIRAVCGLVANEVEIAIQDSAPNDVFLLN